MIQVIFRFFAVLMLMYGYGTARAAASERLQEVTLQLKWEHQFQFAGYYAAFEQGFYREEGLNVTIVPGGPEVSVAAVVSAGEADFGILDSELILERITGSPFVLLAVIFQHSPRALMLLEDSAIVSLAGFVDKPIVLNIPESAEFMAMFVREGISPGRLNISQKDPRTMDRLVAGEIAAMNGNIGNQPFLLRGRDTPVRLIRPIDYGVDFYGDSLFTSEHFLAAQPARVASFRRATLRGWKYAMGHVDETVDLIIEKYAPAKTRDSLQFEAASMQSLILPNLVEIGHVNPGRIQRIADTYVGLGLAPKDHDLSGFFYGPNPMVGHHWIYLFSGSLVGFIVVSLLAWIGSRKLREAIIRRTRDLKESEACYRAVAEDTPVLICRFLPGGEITYVNQAYGNYFNRSVDDLVGSSFLALVPEEEREGVVANIAMMTVDFPNQSHEHPVIAAGGKISWTRWTNRAVFDDDGELIAYQSIGEDITERKRAEEALRASNRALTVLTELNQVLVRATEENELLRRACEILVETGGYRLAWIGFAEEDEAKSVRPVAQMGYDEGYLDTLNISWADAERGRGPTGTAIRTGQPVAARHILTDPNFAPWRETAIEHGYASSLSLPLMKAGRAFGALSLYSSEPDAFDEEEEKLLLELTDDVAYGIVALRTRVEHERTEEALRASREKYQDLYDNAPDMFVSVDAVTGNILECNATLIRSTGYSRDEIVGHPIFDRYHPDSQEGAKQVFQSFLDTGEVYGVELQLLRKDGSRIDVSLSVSAVRDAEGTILQSRSVWHDITARKEAEARAARFDRVLEGMLNEIYLFDAETLHFIEVNRGARENLGYSAEELRDLTPVYLLKPEITMEAFTELLEPLRTGLRETVQFSTVHQRKDGSRYPVEVHLQLMRDASPVFVAIVLDITKRREAEEALRKSEERLDLAMSVANDGMWDWNIETGAIYFDPRYYTMAGYEPYEFPPDYEEWGQRVHPDDIVETEKKLQAYRDGTISALDVQFRFCRKGGEWMWIRGRGKVVARDECGTALRMIGTHSDITNVLKLEAQLRQSQKMEAVGQLAGGVAHDFNNLLQVILGYGDMILEETETDNTVRASIEEMLKAAERAKTLVQQLLAFSRRQVLEMKDIDLNDTIADLMKMIRRVIGEHIMLDVLAGHDFGTVHADPAQITQILMNLCVNARDAMATGGTIIIETENVRIDEAYCASHIWAKPGRYALLSVTDTGCGMDKETLVQVFEPFFTTKGIGKGTGLGLAMVYGLVKQHQGLVHVYSEVGKGTTFKIYLPLVERSATSVGDKIEGPVPGGTETILLAEDDASVRKLSELFLESAGYVVRSAGDGEEALRVFEEYADDIDLALLDVMMPKLGGRAVFEKIHKVRPKIPVLFTSGYSMNAIHTSFVLDEGLQLIQKPCQRSDLLRRVRAVLDSRENEEA